ncbi:uncharacterized protein TNCV_3295821 [Trichonephila clavipes]|uniref:Tc1-like transposase DDE domain-containing protein n=1 Tax=Trichonephila clavipes TaxID=2585209 RepID=A0A8X6VSY3_TRICX|nr:uncharacterized protein TNCV_3295821 [Trichonephila clavipes]
MQITGNHQIARIIRYNDESVREGYIRNGGKEVKFFTSALKAFQCNNRIVIAQKKHLDDFLRGIIERQELLNPAGSIRGTWNRPECHLQALATFPRLWFSLQSHSLRTLIWRAPGTRYHHENTIERHRYGGAGWLVLGGIILGSRTDLHVQSATMTGHIYRDIILEQHVRLFQGAMDAEFLFMDDNVRPHPANIVDQ